jgi:protein required for attachment to host cells
MKPGTCPAWQVRSPACPVSTHQSAAHIRQSLEHSVASRIELSFRCINEDDMAATWIVSANASRARFFSQANPSANLDEINDMVNDAVRLRTAATESDKIGPLAATKSQHNVGAARPGSSYEPNQTPDERQIEMFAKDVADFLQRSHREGRFQQLSLVASPQFLGILRKELDPNLESAISLEINKDYTQFSPDQLREQIQAQKAKE